MRDLLQLSEGYRSKQQEQLWTQASASSEKANWNSWAIRMEFEPISELQQFMGMVNQLGKFSQNPTDLTQPLRQARIQHGFGVHSKTDLAFASVKAKLMKPCNHTSPLQPASTNKSVCWRIILQIRSCVDAEMPIWEELWPMHHDLWLTQKRGMLRLRKKHWRQHGHVRSLQHTYWGWSFL